jgi:hypothetical protein
MLPSGNYIVIFHVLLAASVGLASALALWSEHKKKKPILNKPGQSEPISMPRHVRWLAWGAILTTLGSVTKEVDNAISENERKATDHSRFDANITRLGLIADNLEQANKGIRNQAIESCDQFTTNMDNLERVTEQLSDITASMKASMDQG